MLGEVSIYRWMLLLVAVFVFGGMSWINSGPIGNAGAWFAVVLAIGGFSAGSTVVPR